MAGYPGTIAATWQRAGRAGRRASRSAAVLVASSAPLDQFIVRNPSYFFDRVAGARAHRSRQPAHPRRPREVRGVRAAVHARRAVRPRTTCRRCSAFSPSRGSCIADPASTRPDAGDSAATRRAHWTWTSESYPADAVSLRSVSSDNFVVVDTTHEPRVIGETDFTSGPATLHPKAIYIVEGAAVSGREARLRGAQGVRPRDRLRLLHRRDHLHAGHGPRHVRARTTVAPRGRRVMRRRTRRAVARTAKSTWSRASSASRRSSSTRTRTSARASSICPSSRCTRRRTG